MVLVCVHVPSWRILWLSDGGSSCQQTGEVKSLPGITFNSLCDSCLVHLAVILNRKGTLLFNNIFSIIPAVMMGVSEIAKSYEIIIVARFIVGICAGQMFSTIHCGSGKNCSIPLTHPFLSAGLSSNVVPMYLGELSPKNLRGALGIVPQLFITIGILSAQVLGIRSILGNSTSNA